MRDPQVAREKKPPASGSAASKKGSKKASKKAQGQTAQPYDTEMLEEAGRVTATKKVRTRRTGLNRL
jgi:hypothetical protein